MKKYRIKTEQEFIDEFGYGWRGIVRKTWVSPEMDNLFNKEIIESEYFELKCKTINMGCWSISIDMVKEYEVEKEFVLPQNWYIHVIGNHLENSEVWEWRKRLFGVTDGATWNKSGYINNKGLWDSYASCMNNEITFDQFKKYVLKINDDMKKEDFTIEGSIALKEAFVKESGMKDSNIDYSCNLTSSNTFDNALTCVNTKYSKHFILPEQWKEALEYVKFYFTEEFKVGDWVTTTTKVEPYLNKCNIGETFMITEITDKSALFEPNNGVTIDRIRKATQEEIEKAKREQYKVGDWVFCNSIGTPHYSNSYHPVQIVEVSEDSFRYNLHSDETLKSYYTENKSFKYDLSEIIRKATPEEIEKVKVIVVDGYKAEFNGNYVKFGCKTLYTDDLRAIKRVISLCNTLGDQLLFTGDRTTCYSNSKRSLSLETINKLLNKLED